MVNIHEEYMRRHEINESEVDIKVWNALNTVQQIIDESNIDLIQFLRLMFEKQQLIWSILSNDDILKMFEDKGKYTIKQVKK